MIIDLKNISVSFDGEPILKNLNLYIRDKEFITLLGPSGCGKTTTLRIIGGFLEPDEGTVIFDGKKINGVPPHKRQVNTIFQRYALFPHLDVYENIAFGLRVKKWPEKKIRDKVNEMLALVNLKGFKRRKIASLSGGQQQRLALARTLAHPRPLLVLDDPFSALDRKTEEQVFANLRKMTASSTVLLISHRLYLFPQMDGVLWIQDGKAVCAAHEELIVQNPQYAALVNAQEGGEQDEPEK